jgi:HAMP domain-containing protein
MKSFKDLYLGVKFSIIAALSLSIVFAILITIIYFQQKSKLIEEKDARFFSQLADLVSIIDEQRKGQEEKVKIALLLAEKLIQAKGQIIETDSLVDFTYIAPTTNKKQNTKLKAWYWGGRLLQGDSLLTDDFQVLTGNILSIEQASSIGYLTISSSKIPALGSIRTVGSVTTQQAILEAIEANRPYLGTSIGSISKKIITVASKNLATDKGSKVIIYAFTLLEENETIQKNIIQKKYAQSDFTYLTNKEGIILFHPKPSYVGQDLGKSNIFQNIAKNLTGQHKLAYKGDEGTRHLQYYTYYPPFDMFVNIVIPESELLDLSLSSLRNFLIWSAVIAILFCNLTLAFFISIFSTKPIKKILFSIRKLAQGKSLDMEEATQKDEYGQIFRAINQLTERLNRASNFAKEVGNGNFEHDYTALGQQDELGNALLEMRNNLKQINEEESRHKWVSEGISKFNELIQMNVNQIQEVTFQVLSELMGYVNAHQGAIFLVAEDEGKEPCLELIACHIYGRRKYLSKRVYEGEGLVGQVWQTGEEIYLKKIPPHYAKIGVELGEVMPSCLFVVPLKFNEVLQGVLEITSAHQFEAPEKELIVKVMELLASAVSIANFTANTKKLLAESQYMMENLRSQEEEVRQNYEELQATQEEMSRRERESKSEKEALIQSIKTLEKNSI